MLLFYVSFCETILGGIAMIKRYVVCYAVRNEVKASDVKGCPSLVYRYLGGP